MIPVTGDGERERRWRPAIFPLAGDAGHRKGRKNRNRRTPFHVAIGCVIGPIRSGWNLGQNASVYVQPELWSTLTDPTCEMCHRLWVPVITYETVGSALHFSGAVVLAGLFLTKRRVLPPAIIGFNLLSTAF